MTITLLAGGARAYQNCVNSFLALSEISSLVISEKWNLLQPLTLHGPERCSGEAMIRQASSLRILTAKGTQRSVICRLTLRVAVQKTGGGRYNAGAACG